MILCRLHAPYASFKLLKSLEGSTTSAINCAKEVAWYDPIWRLIVKSSKDDSHVDELSQELLETVVKCVFYILWFGIEGNDHSAWKVRDV